MLPVTAETISPKAPVPMKASTSGNDSAMALPVALGQAPGHHQATALPRLLEPGQGQDGVDGTPRRRLR